MSTNHKESTIPQRQQSLQKRLPNESRGKINKIQQTTLDMLPVTLPVSFLREITNDFSTENILSHSAFGEVFKGTLPDGHLIALKKLFENSPMSLGKIFDTEVTNLMALCHENIVELVGFCHEARKDVVNHNGRQVIVDIMECFLCYKYLPNGSLDKYIYESSTLDWDTRFVIIKGICRGLQYLHERPEGPVIHMNIIPSSIWLNDNWEPKIADFFLSRLFGQELTRINTQNVVGYNGYMAPEYLYRGEISTMSDIYSLGMLIIEITTGERNDGNVKDRSAREFVEKVREKYHCDDAITLKWPSLPPVALQQVKICIETGLICVNVERAKRPSIDYIVDKLNGKRVI